MAVMATTRAWPDVWPSEDRPLTVADMADMPDDGNRYELDEGMLIVSPAPFNNHQWVVDRLHLILAAACPPEYIVLTGPGINLSQDQHRVPDLAVVRAEGFRIDYVFEDRPPALAVEVSSRSTARYDRTRKKAVYAQSRIPWYWIVTPDPASPAVQALRLSGAGYVQVTRAGAGERFEADQPFPVAFDPAVLVTTEPLR